MEKDRLWISSISVDSTLDSALRQAKKRWKAQKTQDFRLNAD